MFQEQDGELIKNGPQPTDVDYHLETAAFKVPRPTLAEALAAPYGISSSLPTDWRDSR